MKSLVCLSLTLAMALCLVVATESRAWGYVDPGSGLLTLQAAASAMATAFYFASRHIRNFFLRKKSGPGVDPGDLRQGKRLS